MLFQLAHWRCQKQSGKKSRHRKTENQQGCNTAFARIKVENHLITGFDEKTAFDGLDCFHAGFSIAGQPLTCVAAFTFSLWNYFYGYGKFFYCGYFSLKAHKNIPGIRCYG